MVSYSPEIADKLCELIVEGNSLKKIEKMPGMPTKRSVLYWQHQHPEFRTKYDIARQMQAEGIVDEILEVIKDKKLPAREKSVRIQAISYLAGKFWRDRYGDRTVVEHQGKIDIDGAKDRLDDLIMKSIPKAEAETPPASE